MKMKYGLITRLICGALWLVLITGCSDFLEESSQDEVRPSSASDLQQVLLGEGYQLAYTVMPYLDMLTDDVKNNYTESANQQEYLEKGRYPFTWDLQMFEKLQQLDVSGSDSWSGYYKYIKGCNVVLDMIDGVDGTEAEKGNVKGQALALRAYYYFMLANLYAQPYNASGIDRNSEPCVPLMLHSKVSDDYPARNTMTEVYDRIEKDLLEAEPLMDRYGQSNIKDKVTQQFVHLLLCRLYLYEERYDECIQQADIVLRNQPGLLKIANYDVRDNNGFYQMHVYHPDSPELIWCYSSNNENSNFQGVVNGSDTPAYLVSDELVALYDYKKDAKVNKGDVRAGYFFTYYNVGNMVFNPITGTFTQKTAMYWGCHNYNSGDASKGFRTAEAYLNRAECYVRKFMQTGNDEYRKNALSDFNRLRASRWDGVYTDVDIQDADALWTFCREERRRELAFDDHRWFDLRRWGMPRIVHTITLTKGQPMEYVLEKGDKRYVLPIPQEALDRNPSLVQNPQ